jgi:hypothetical protein
MFINSTLPETVSSVNATGSQDWSASVLAANQHLHRMITQYGVIGPLIFLLCLLMIVAFVLVCKASAEPSQRQASSSSNTDRDASEISYIRI